MCIHAFAFMRLSLLIKQKAAEFVSAIQVRVEGLEFDMSQHFARIFVCQHDAKGLLDSVK